MSGQGKSSELEALGVTQVEVVTSTETPKAQQCRAGIVAAMALALGCVLGTPQAQAAGLETPAEPTRSEAALDTVRSVVGVDKGMSTQGKVLSVGAKVAEVAITGDYGRAASHMAAEAAIGGAIAAGTKDVGIGRAGGDTAVKVGIAALTGNPVAAMSAINSGLNLGNEATGFDKSGNVRRGAETVLAIGGAVITGGGLAAAYAGKTIYDNAKAQIAQNKFEEEQRAVEREKRLAGVAQGEREAIWNAEREARQQWPAELLAFDQQRMLAMANEEVSKNGALTSPEAIRRYGVEAQREADGLPVEPWYEQHQAFKAEQEAEMRQTIEMNGGYHG